MIRAAFLGHSGFAVELPGVTLLFDWTEGELPALRREVPLLVFASHGHGDHFRPEIFSLDDGEREVCFLLGKDIKLSPRNRARWGLSDATADKCLRLGGGERTEALPGVTAETLTSTDEGVAFLVTAEGRTVFHAGDLNRWHWEGEDPAWNQAMERNFLRYTEPLRDRRIDLAMLPLDPRLGEDGFRGPRHFLEIAEISCFLPMHQWGDYGFTERFLERFPRFADRTVRISGPGETVTLA